MWKLDRTLRDCLNEIYKAAEDPKPPLPGAEPVTDERIIETANLCFSLHAIIEAIYTRAKEKGLTSSYLIGVVFNSVKTRSEEILDIGDALLLCTDAEVDALLDHAIDDLHKGAVYDLPSFK